MIGKYVASVAIVAVCLLSGCANVVKAGRESSDQAKQFAHVSDKAVLYVYRDEIMGTAIKLPVLVDGVLVGETGPKSFLQLGLAPGKHTIQSVSEVNASVDIDMAAGQDYYVWQEVKMGLFAARSAVHVVNAPVGKAGVMKCDMLVATVPAMRITPSHVMAPETETRAVEAAPVAPTSASASTAVTIPASAPASTTARSSERATATAVTADSDTALAVNAVDVMPEGTPAVLDPRVDKPMFVAAQDIASLHQCERLIRVRTVDGNNAHFYSACPGSSTPIEIVCNGASCHEGAPQG
jgi:hypothetical protein